MRASLWQVAVIVSVLTSGILYAAEPGQYAKQLRAESDALMQSAIRRPYGWGWDNVASENLTASSAPRHVTMQPLGTPAAGILLLWSGQLLDEPKYKQAAFDAARGITASQAGNGIIPTNVIFGSGAKGRDEPRAVPDRSSTTASLALLLSLLDETGSKPEMASRAAHRAAYWLATQQAKDGGWPLAYPADAVPNDAIRIIRLDDADYRNSTYALLLAAQILNEPPLGKNLERSITKLLALRQLPDEPTTQPTTEPMSVQSSQLWSSVYRPNGMIDASLKDFPAGTDVIASRYAMQTLLGDYLVTGRKQSAIALDTAAGALSDLQRPDGTWLRVYLAHPTTAPTTNEVVGGMFEPPANNQGPWMSGTFDLDPILESAKQLKVLGREKYLAMMSQQFSTQQQLAAAICGLNDDPLTLDLPVSGSEVEGYVQKHAADFAILDSPLPEDLPARLKRLWILLIRAKCEQMRGG
jgi:hypothetical protein